LQDHYDRHGADFSATSPDDYAAQAWRFRERVVAEKLPMKWDGDTVRMFDPKSGAFAAFNRDGTTKTYFKPGGQSYWQRQPGKPITTPPWGAFSK
jgi:pyocin large subunit-like protein